MQGLSSRKINGHFAYEHSPTGDHVQPRRELLDESNRLSQLEGSRGFVREERRGAVIDIA
jgi:hypothetical protein